VPKQTAIRWAYEAAAERILRKRLQERYDKGFLAGIGTAMNAFELDSEATIIERRLKMREAREGYLQEIESR
jgi:hypothetical protein